MRAREAWREDPKNLDTRKLLGHLNELAGEYSEALREYRAVLLQRPNDVEAMQAVNRLASLK